MAVYTVNITDGGTFASLDVGLGRGPKGDGFTGGSFNAATGQITFTSNDGIGFTTGDVRVDLGAPGPIGDVTPGTGDFTSVAVTGELTAAQYNSTEALPDIKPSLNLDFANTKALDPRITYTRGSTATYYDGVTFAKAEENLLIRSQEFDTAAWTKLNVAITANDAVAPDGTTTADKITAQAVTGDFYPQQNITTISGEEYVFSVYAKAGTHNYVQLVFGFQFNSYANFDITSGAGATGTSAGVTSTAIKDVGSGWYRCSVVVESTAPFSNVICALADSASMARLADWTAAGTETVYLWGAQLEQRDALTDYTATTDQPITNYIPALQTAASGEPRFDHDPITGESKGFLIEEQRTNLLTYSEQFDNAAWTKSNSSITSNIVVAPDGTLTGDKLVEDTTNSGKVIYDSVTVADNSFITYSCYFKEAGRSRVGLEFYGAGGLTVLINLDAGTINVGTPYDSGTDASGTITPVGNGWYRVSLTLKTKSGDTSGFVQIRLLDDSNNSTYTGDGYSGIYIWGAQLEAGGFPTSYIPTVASQVTRSPDAASMTGTNFSSWYRQDEGSFYCETATSKSPSVATTEYPFSVNDNSTSNFLGLRFTAAKLNFRADTNGSNQLSATIEFGYTADQYYQTAVSYKINDFAATSDGNSPLTDSSGLIPAVDRFQLSLLSNYINGHIKKLAYYPKRLSNATLQALTEE